ncbi:hypothetical protein QTP70_005820 [Hemibagrus guttatus]|uniref:Reverse transcriptase domain-containing protein n=1 Tax=Hemibagrus guttatus TaxID=175788 RepID=A0AAE0RAI0_9TELE|nr:hypothetical protein QTP70_005820 [Hemibagrus guttatus]
MTKEMITDPRRKRKEQHTPIYISEDFTWFHNTQQRLRKFGMSTEILSNFYRWGNKAYKVTALLDGQPMKIEIDTGAAMSLVSDVVYSEILSHLPLKPPDVILKTYTGESVTMKGHIQVQQRKLQAKDRTFSTGSSVLARNYGSGPKWVPATVETQTGLVSYKVVLPDDWETTAEVIRETGRKVLNVSSGRRKEDKETWWWNEEVQDSIQRKRLAKKKWDMDRTEENRQEYKELQRRVKREVSKAKQKAYDELYTRLDTREGEKDLYRLARQRDQDGKDVQQVRVIKDRDGRVHTSEESVQRRWKEYFEELMNEENEREKRVEGVNSVEQKVNKIRMDEVRKALKRMKSGKAVGPDDILVEVWKCLGEAAVEFLNSLFNRVLENLEKAYDRVPREELWYCMRKSGVAEKYVRVVQDMYERSRTVVRCAVVMDQLSEEVRQESPWTMMFADDIVICSESREQVEENLERWRFALERRGMKVSRIQNNGECGKEVKKRVQAETVSLRKRQQSELEVAELKMLRFSLGVTRLDRIRNKYIRGTGHVGRLGDKVREARLRWFGHVQRRESEYIGRRMLDMELPGRRQRGRPKRRYMDGINEDMKLVGASVEDAEDRDGWREMIRCGVP